ncbi:uncharacterized protein YALI1_C19826g [Yarrowia lipolytica]|uniref:Uncharacterized protein n=1 Tax=Yarrowia lipolytica TaxID=4952 RepID=A0A1D8NB44_YARLL|nr:hypothetical protein YALI1_C19826g [Yarrowia lipolytica]
MGGVRVKTAEGSIPIELLFGPVQYGFQVCHGSFLDVLARVCHRITSSQSTFMSSHISLLVGLSSAVLSSQPPFFARRKSPGKILQTGIREIKELDTRQ